jgi:hypothetical protein
MDAFTELRKVAEYCKENNLTNQACVMYGLMGAFHDAKEIHELAALVSKFSAEQIIKRRAAQN